MFYCIYNLQIIHIFYAKILESLKLRFYKNFKNIESYNFLTKKL